jgi:hypothetical protein
MLGVRTRENECRLTYPWVTHQVLSMVPHLTKRSGGGGAGALRRESRREEDKKEEEKEEEAKVTVALMKQERVSLSFSPLSLSRT